MTDDTHPKPSLKEFDADADRNGQDFGTASPLDVGIPSRTQADLKSDPDGRAEAARIASGTPRQDAMEQTEAETPPENLSRISDPSTSPTGPDDKAREAIDRATAAVGQEPSLDASSDRGEPRHGQ